MWKRLFGFFEPKKTTCLLGRWSLKTCEDIKSATNAVYQNRDHCGDLICKTPKQASEYFKVPKKEKKSTSVDGDV